MGEFWGEVPTRRVIGLAKRGYDMSGYRGTGSYTQRGPRMRSMARVATPTSLLKWGSRVVCTAFLEPATWRCPRLLEGGQAGIWRGNGVARRGGLLRSAGEWVGLASNWKDKTLEVERGPNRDRTWKWRREEGGRTLTEDRGAGLASNFVESAPEALPKALLADNVLIHCRSPADVPRRHPESCPCKHNAEVLKVIDCGYRCNLLVLSWMIDWFPRPSHNQRTAFHSPQPGSSKDQIKNKK